MGHHIAAIVIAGPYDAERAASLDLIARLSHPPVTLFPIDHYYSAYWAKRRERPGMLPRPVDASSIWPGEIVIADLVREIAPTCTRFAIIQTDYFGGAGTQWAGVYEGETLIPVARINEALRLLGVTHREGEDEFDTIGLGDLRHSPASLERYRDLCDEIGA